MRVVAGRFGGRTLVGPGSERVRPTSDRLRESLFNVIEHGYGGLAGVRVIDLFAGTGALAVEALSRGASYALLVDDGPEARAAMRANIEALGLGGITRVFRRDARRLGIAPAGGRFGLAFLDPPYGRGFVEPTLVALREGGWLESNALVVIEELAETALIVPEGFSELETRIAGISKLMFLRADGSGRTP